jgi:hypothetical protein
MDFMHERDAQYHTYADYLIWSATSGDELIDGVAYVREPPAPSRLHQDVVVELCRQVTKSLEGRPCRVYVAPFDYSSPIVCELRGRTALTAVPAVSIDWIDWDCLPAT